MRACISLSHLLLPTLALLTSGCAAGTGELEIQVVDPGANSRQVPSDEGDIEDADHLWLTVSEVTVHWENLYDPDAEEAAGDPWIVVEDRTQTLDLLALEPADRTSLGLSYLEPGHYQETRLLVEEATLDIDGERFPVTVPSGGSSGLKVKTDFDIEPGHVTILTLSFDASQSLSWNNGNGYKLDPVIDLLSVEYLDRYGDPVN